SCRSTGAGPCEPSFGDPRTKRQRSGGTSRRSCWRTARARFSRSVGLSRQAPTDRSRRAGARGVRTNPAQAWEADHEKRTMKSAVYLIGAGPGDASLITVRGLRYLESADVVLYDHLVPQRLLRHAKPGAEMIDVGDAAPQPLEQEAICYLLAEKA